MQSWACTLLRLGRRSVRLREWRTLHAARSDMTTGMDADAGRGSCTWVLRSKKTGGHYTHTDWSTLWSSSPIRFLRNGRSTPFQGILDDMRRELALSYLEQPDIELEEAAYLLGYSEASAFRRAFKRWKGERDGIPPGLTLSRVASKVLGFWPPMSFGPGRA